MQRLIVVPLALVAGMAQAQDAALVLGTERYEQLGRLARGAEVVDAAKALERFGFEVVALPNGRAGSTAAALAEWIDGVDEAERLVVALSGRFATDGDRTWFLTAEIEGPGLLSLGDRAVSVDALMAVLATRPGQAVLLLGVEPESGAYDAWLSAGIGPLDVPQGVTVIRGAPRPVAQFLGSEMVVPEGDLIALARANGRMTLSGFVPSTLVLMPEEGEVRPPEPEEPQGPDAAEVALWEGAKALDTVVAYRNYLARYPRGAFSAEAEELIAAIVAEPNRDARLAEETMALTRDQRRNIQRNLSLLNFDPRGIDGIFGPGTRRAITNWQQQNGFPQTSYLTPEQVDRLEAQAARRAAELEAEAERARQAETRRDRAFWEETGAVGDEPGLRAYLERYPDGLFAEAARTRLATIEAANRQQAASEDRTAWDAARAADTVAAYEDYVRAFPRGRFLAEAEARAAELRTQDQLSQGQRAAEAAEAALGLNSLTLRLIEARLEQLGLEPGEVDGVIDEQTRRALRRYQRDRGMEPSGFISEQALIRLLADAFEDR